MENFDSLTKNYYQLFLIVIDEISLVGSKMLSFIDCRLQIIKQNHNDFTCDLDVIMTSNFYQMPLVIHGFLNLMFMGLMFWEQIFGMNM